LNLVSELQSAIAKGADLDEKDQFGATPLHYAVAERNDYLVGILLEHGADVLAQDMDGKTSLHYAIEYRLPSVAERLLRKSTKVVHISDKFGNQPLWTAAFNANGDYELVSLLLSFGGDARHCNSVNLTPLDIASRKSDDALLYILSSHPAK
jgi:ankyrin repeat protein